MTEPTVPFGSSINYITMTTFFEIAVDETVNGYGRSGDGGVLGSLIFNNNDKPFFDTLKLQIRGMTIP